MTAAVRVGPHQRIAGFHWPPADGAEYVIVEFRFAFYSNFLGDVVCSPYDPPTVASPALTGWATDVQLVPSKGYPDNDGISSISYNGDPQDPAAWTWSGVPTDAGSTLGDWEAFWQNLWSDRGNLALDEGFAYTTISAAAVTPPEAFPAFSSSLLTEWEMTTPEWLSGVFCGVVQGGTVVAGRRWNALASGPLPDSAPYRTHVYAANLDFSGFQITGAGKTFTAIAASVPPPAVQDSGARTVSILCKHEPPTP